MTKKVYKVQGMHCTSCAVMIESDLEDAGVRASCDYAKAILEVEFDESKVKEAVIHKTVKSAGYTLQ